MDTNETPVEQASVTVDVLILSIDDGRLSALLVKRAEKPYPGMWAIPGAFIWKGESLEEAAKRVALDKIGVEDLYLEQLYTFGDPDRDPRKRVVTVTYLSLIPWKKLGPPVSRQVSEVRWFPVKEAPALAFDHAHILEYGRARLEAKASYSNIVYGLLPDKFRLSDLQRIYEIILDKPLDKRNFRKRMLSLGLLARTGQKEVVGAHRPAELYRFKTREIVFFD
ncbi:MAG: NUDIX domain-containing protein [Anaerolineae bacterium]